MPGQPISHYFKEVARDMVVNPKAYQVFGNAEGKLPKAKTKNKRKTGSRKTGSGLVFCMGMFRLQSNFAKFKT